MRRIVQYVIVSIIVPAACCAASFWFGWTQGQKQQKVITWAACTEFFEPSGAK